MASRLCSSNGHDEGSAQPPVGSEQAQVDKRYLLAQVQPG